MAILSREAYEGKRRWADARMAANAEIDTLTPEQHETLAWLCRIRHEMHTHQEAFFFDESSEHDEFWNYIESDDGTDIDSRLREVGLPGIRFPGAAENYITDSTWRDDGYETIEEAESESVAFAERINSIIEIYLTKIDTEHGTNYAPSGETRL